MGCIRIFSRLCFAVCLSLCLGTVVPAVCQQTLRGHLPFAISALGLQPKGRLDSTKQLTLAIGLPLQNQQGLKSFLDQLYDPASPGFRQYLTTAQFTEQFGPSKQDFQAVVNFAAANGLTVTGMPPNRMLVLVTGTARKIEKALHVNMQVYEHPTEARTFFAPDHEPSLDVAAPVLHVSGLDNYSLTRPRMNKNRKVGTSSIPAGVPYGRAFRKAYAPDVTLDGSGQIVGLVQFNGYHPEDIRIFRERSRTSTS